MGTERTGPSWSHPPIDVRGPLRRVNGAMLELLAGLGAEDWHRPTVHPRRDVKDLVAHMLDGSMRRLACHRDGYAVPPEAPIDSYQGLVDHIQAINREWMRAARRLSPRMLIELTRQYDDELADFFEALDPHGEAPFSVAWAGEARSPVWFDVARDYTEKWHHQQQLRDATGRPALYEPALLEPTISTFALGWPHALRTAEGAEGTRVRVEITGPLRLARTLTRGAGGWALDAEAAPPGSCAAGLSLDADCAWRLWTRGLPAAAARARAVVTGQAALVEPLFDFVAIMA